MAGWNFAELWETAAEAHPDAPALVQGERRLTWAEVDHRADGVARWLVDLGVEEQDKVAQYLYNCPEYMESMFACYKAGLAPVNTNYRYGPAELRYLWDNADAVAVVFHGCFAERIEPLRRELPKVRGWLWVDDGSGPCPSWAVPYEEAARSAPVGERTRAPWGRSGDHLYLLYTGGTTGMPKGVMWRQDDLVVLVAGLLLGGLPDEPDYELFRSRLPNPPPVGLPACPLMHGTGALVSKGVWTQGGCVVTLTSRRYDPVELLETIGRERVNVLAIVGDAFAKPMLRALEAEPERFDVSSLMAITSSGVMWSEETKRGLLARNPNMVLLDAFSSSEALGMGASVSGGGTAAATAKFQLGEKAVVIGEDGRLVEAGSGEIGMVGVGGRIPLGYYKDPEKTAKTFKVVDGKRYSIPGDFARVEADGTITLLGRGSVCINTAGEKVFPEEVEEVVKRLPEVADCVVVGVPDERWGEAVTALVEPQPGATLDEATVVAHVRGELADYKVPKRVLVVDSIGRAPNGKVDYRRCRERAMEAVGVQVG
ncbi:acyl-CoA synthetase [Aciditerrimonas ferrireducens]|uniref:Acyl-CoA synthetase n=1 Tax=Aciditerrimonas ferrireducens TaxID=667306 RepID=A0ABV6C0J2_9ACTN